MSHPTTSRIKHIIARSHQVWKELDYAQQRAFEIQTGLVTTRPSTRPSGHRAWGCPPNRG
jgi:hypothetical protein